MRKQLLALALTIPIVTITSLASPSASSAGSKSSSQLTATALDQPAAGEKKTVASDAETTKSILTKIIHEDPDIAVSAKHLKISTVNGRVTLSGKVRNETQKNKAGSIAESVVGAALVDNQITFK
ncbi:MAG: Transport-associated protein [Pedosphaera sp.]|nr:Transport-associated protein [Pedosphaera sp.]